MHNETTATDEEEDQDLLLLAKAENEEARLNLTILVPITALMMYITYIMMGGDYRIPQKTMVIVGAIVTTIIALQWAKWLRAKKNLG